MAQPLLFLSQCSLFFCKFQFLLLYYVQDILAFFSRFTCCCWSRILPISSTVTILSKRLQWKRVN